MIPYLILLEIYRVRSAPLLKQKQHEKVMLVRLFYELLSLYQMKLQLVSVMEIRLKLLNTEHREIIFRLHIFQVKQTTTIETLKPGITGESYCESMWSILSKSIA